MGFAFVVLLEQVLEQRLPCHVEAASGPDRQPAQLDDQIVVATRLDGQADAGEERVHADVRRALDRRGDQPGQQPDPVTAGELIVQREGRSQGGLGARRDQAGKLDATQREVRGQLGETETVEHAAEQFHPVQHGCGHRRQPRFRILLLVRLRRQGERELARAVAQHVEQPLTIVLDLDREPGPERHQRRGCQREQQVLTEPVDDELGPVATTGLTPDLLLPGERVDAAVERARYPLGIGHSPFGPVRELSRQRPAPQTHRHGEMVELVPAVLPLLLAVEEVVDQSRQLAERFRGTVAQRPGQPVEEGIGGEAEPRTVEAEVQFGDGVAHSGLGSRHCRVAGPAEAGEIHPLPGRSPSRRRGGRGVPVEQSVDREHSVQDAITPEYRVRGPGEATQAAPAVVPILAAVAARQVEGQFQQVLEIGQTTTAQRVVDRRDRDVERLLDEPLRCPAETLLVSARERRPQKVLGRLVHVQRIDAVMLTEVMPEQRPEQVPEPVRRQRPHRRVLDDRMGGIGAQLDAVQRIRADAEIVAELLAQILKHAFDAGRGGVRDHRREHPGPAGVPAAGQRRPQ